MMAKDLIRNGKLYLYGPVGGSFWDDSGFTDEDVIAALSSMSGDIKVHVNSPGGSVFQGVAIHTALSEFEGTVTIQIDALAASAASLIACAGDVVVAAPGAQIMIHDPSDVTWGTADDHRKKAAMLDSISRSAANIYADKTGLSVDECLSMMADETWMDAATAVSKGFADKVSGDGHDAPSASMTVFPAFDYTAFKHAPTPLMVASIPLDFKGHKVSMSAPAAKPAASAAQPKEPIMAKPDAVDPVATLEASAIRTPRMSAGAFLELGEKHNLTAAQMRAVQKKARPADAGADESDPIDPVLARDAVLDILAKRQPETPENHPATVTLDARDKFVTGATLALSMRSGMGGERNEYSGMTTLRLAEESLRMSGQPIPTNREQIARMALGANPRMAHTTGDFPNILEAVAHKAMLKGHDEVEETFGAFTSRGSLPDFKEGSRVDLSTFPALKSVVEGAEYKDATLTDRKEKIKLAKYGNVFTITWEAIVNDDLDIFSKVPQRMGRAAKRTVGNLVYGVLTGNPALSDGVALFHATHKNLATGAGSVFGENSLSDLAVKMGLQKDGESTLNIRAKYLLVPRILEPAAKTLIASEFSPGETQRVPNKVRNLVEVVSDSRLDEASSTAWYLAADPSMFDTIEVAYLDGQEAPEMFEEQGFRVDGISYKIRQVAGVAPLSFRTMAKSAGA